VKTDFAGKECISQTIDFRGHMNILGTHLNTIEITTETEISKRADCIVGVCATKSCANLNREIVDHIKSNGRMTFVISVAELEFNFTGYGSKELSLTDEKEIVLRKSDFISPRTLAIRCDAAAIDVPRHMINLLKSSDARGSLKIIAVDGLLNQKLPKIDFG
jgi:uncharacterized protein